MIMHKHIPWISVVLLVQVPLISESEELCKSDDVTEKDHGIEISLPEEQHLFADRDETATVTLKLWNRFPEEVTNLVVSHRENFYYSRSSKHVQLVRETNPNYVAVLLSNQTLDVVIRLSVPNFVELGHQNKVTLVVEKPKRDNPITGHDVYETSFLFTVSDKPLSEYDEISPECGEESVCENECPDDYDYDVDSSVSTCNETYWSGELLIRDNITGLRAVAVEQGDVHYEDIVLKVQKFTIGSTKWRKVSVQSSCCLRGLLIDVEDIAGNVAQCPVGEVASGVLNKPSSLVYLLSILAMKGVAFNF